MEGVHGVGEGVAGGGLEGMTGDELDGLLDRALDGEPQHAEGFLPATQALASLASVPLEEDEQPEAQDGAEALHDWYIAPEGTPVGPLPVAEVRGRFERGELTPETPCWSAGLSRWVPVSQVLQLSTPVVSPARETPVTAALQVVETSFATPPPRQPFQPVANAVLRALVAEEERARTGTYFAVQLEPQPAPVEPRVPGVEAAPIVVAAPAAQPAPAAVEPQPTAPRVAREGFALPLASEAAHASPVQAPGGTGRESTWRALALGMLLGGVLSAVLVVVLLRALMPALTLVPNGQVAPAAATPAPVAATPAPAPAPKAQKKAEPARAEAPKAVVVAKAEPAAAAKRAEAEASKRKGKATGKRAVATEQADASAQKKAEGSGEVTFSEDEDAEVKEAPRPPPTPEQAKLDAAFDAATKDSGAPAEAEAPKASDPSVYVPPAPGSAELPETLTHADVLEVVLANKSDLDGCISAAKRENPGLEGPLVMRWNVSPAGEASDLQAETNDHVGTALEKCVADQIRTWKFPRTRTQGDPVRMPFKL